MSRDMHMGTLATQAVIDALAMHMYRHMTDEDVCAAESNYACADRHKHAQEAIKQVADTFGLYEHVVAGVDRWIDNEAPGE